MTKDIKSTISILEAYLKYPNHHEYYPEDGETAYIIDKLKKLNKKLSKLEKTIDKLIEIKEQNDKIRD